MADGARQPEGLRKRHLRSHLPWMITAVLFTGALTLLAIAANWASEGRIAVMDLLSDPAEVVDIPWYIGAVHDLNLFVWAAGATLYLVAALGLRGQDSPLAWALLCLGAFTVVFVMDDRFLLHEIVYPWLLGLQETVVFGIYAVLLGALLLVFARPLLRQPECVLLILGLIGLGTSVVLDLSGIDLDARRVAEEAAKLLGATAWAMFPAAIMVRHLRSAETRGA